ncbi:NEL-type E3 ubiquitin ligase domain-containing protein [Pseudomonas sp. TE21394]
MMPGSTDQPLHPPMTAEQAFQDAIIAQRLPGWLASATPAQVQALAQAMTLSLYFRQRVSAVLGQIQGIDRFARPLLQAALNLPATIDIGTLQFRQGRREPVINDQPVGSHLTTVVYEQIPLLEAALRNFTADQAIKGGQPIGNGLLGAAEHTLPTACDFAALCRSLDLGGQYQDHLRSILQPPASDDAMPKVKSLIARAQRYAMLVDAHVAWISGQVSEAEHQLLVDFCGLYAPLQLDGRPVQAKRLKLLGTWLEQVVVLDVRDETFSPLYSSTARVLVHIPGDPQGAWRAFPDLRHFANALGKRLRTPQYQRFFSRFVRRRDSQTFFAAVIAGYQGVSDLANISLGEHTQVLSEPVFEALARARIEQLMDDAAMIAVPTRSVDAEQQRAHDQRLAAEGWALLNLAALFVPVIGVGLLAVTAWELLGEVFHGIEAWHEGDTSEALDHVLNVASDVAVMAATVAGASAVRSLWNRSAMVDSLVPVRLEDGTRRLWQPALAAFRSVLPAQASAADSEGIQRLGEQAWVEMDGHHYAVVADRLPGQWRLRARAGHAPRLQHNGAGAWRLWCEQPAQWDGQGYLLRRLGGEFARLDDDDVGLFMATHALDSAQLRGLHVHGHAPGAGMRDSAMRFNLDRRIRQLVSQLRGGVQVIDTAVLEHARRLPGAVGLSDQALAELAWARRRALFERVYVAEQGSQGQDVATLRRLFPGLHDRQAAALLRDARPADRQRLRDTGRVSLNLAAAAREAALEVRVIRVYEGLFLDTPQGADLARAVLGLSEQLPGLARSVRWRLFEGALDGPMLAGSEQCEGCFDLVHLHGQFQLHGAHGVLGEPGELFAVIAAAYDESQQAALGVGDPFAHNLRVLVGRQALQQRALIRRLLGHAEPASWFRPPRRLPDGRIGYPLSGRGEGSGRRARPQGVFASLRAIYSSYTDAQVLAWINDAHQAGRRPEDEVASLMRELETLQTHLHAWIQMGTSTLERGERRYLRDTLVNCWQRSAIRTAGVEGLPSGYRLSLWAVTLQRLPELPEQVSFGHVHELSMMGLGLREFSPGFLRAFPRLQVLELSGNELTRVPPDLQRLAHLRELDLFGNNIVLDASQAMTLANCEALEYVNLSYNPLGRAFPLYRLDRLARLHMRNTGISEFPPALLDRLELVIADLRGNQITELPQRFYRSPAWVSSTVLLEGNPLTAETAQRLQVFMQAHAIPLEQEVIAPAASVRLRWLDAADSALRPEQSSAWDELVTEPGAADFFNLLRRLQETADFRTHRQALANRVFGMLIAMRDYSSLREELFRRAAETLTCQDSVTLCFSNLELHMLVWRARVDAAGGNQEAALLQLGRRLWRLDEVDRIALEDIQARRADGADPDEIEVGLAYRIGLRDSLDLPAQPGDMLFAEVGGVTAQRLEQARVRVEEAETTEHLAASLVAREFWEEHLLRNHAERLEAFNAPYQERSNRLMEAADSMPEAEYMAQYATLQHEREQARHALLLALTREALEAAPEPRTAGQ